VRSEIETATKLFGDEAPGVDASKVVDTLTYVRKFNGRSVLVKLGGASLQDLSLVKKLCEDLALVRAVGVSLVLVHGGGASINDELSRRQMTWAFHDGQRVTTPEMMEVIEMVLCGRVNQRIVRTLNASGIKAVGLSGSDANMLLCRRKKDLGEVGEIVSVDEALLSDYLTQRDRVDGMIPVIAPVGVDREGTPLNVNADWAASKISQALGIRKVIYLTDQDGILDAQGCLISELDAAELEDLINEGVVKGGMLAKSRTILEAIRNNVDEVHVINATRPHALIEELFTNRGIGTICRNRARQC
jgi:acetylglutamate kinase